MGIIFKQQTDVSEEARANRVFWGRTVDYTAERLEVSVWRFLLPEEVLITGLVLCNDNRNSMA